MSTIRRVSVLGATVALVLGACGGASPTVSPQASSAGSASAAATPAPTRSVVATSKPSASASAAAVRPGYILLEHFGNAADGTKLTDRESAHLWLVKADGSDLHELAPGQPLIKGLPGNKGAADWSRDGTHIVFTSASQIPRLYQTDVAGTTPKLLSTDCDVVPVACFEFFGAYSPDGKRIAFVRLTDDGANGVLGIRDLATGKVTLLESTRQGPPKNELGNPRWSPDGTKLVYFETAKGAEGTPPSSSELFIVNADGTGRHKLATPGLAAGDADWSPDGSTIVFSVEPIHIWSDQGVADHPDVYIVHPDGTGLKAVTSDRGSGAPSWTSDGKILYFSQRHLWLADANGSNRTFIGPGGMDLVSDQTGYSYYARWQPVH